MIDLHTHTNESDGSFTPAALIEAAQSISLQALAITDHDTFAGYEKAAPIARAAGFDLVCGIELNSKFLGKNIHLLAYFPLQPPADSFRSWLAGLQASRRDRNARLISRLQSVGVDIELHEVESVGRSLAGRPHFARILVNKGYALSILDAFQKYLSEDAKAYVERDVPPTAEAIEYVLASGGVPVLAHPIRLGKRNLDEEQALIADLHTMGLPGIEAYHSDHGAADSARYLAIAERYRLVVTGGSDFHGDAKPRIQLGTGANQNLSVPEELLQRLREWAGSR